MNLHQFACLGTLVENPTLPEAQPALAHYTGLLPGVQTKKINFQNKKGRSAFFVLYQPEAEPALPV